MCHKRRGSQLVEEAAILLLAIILFSTVYAIVQPIIQRQTQSDQDAFGQIRNLWDNYADPARRAPILIIGNQENGQLKSKGGEDNRTDLKRILVGLASDLVDPEFRGIAFEKSCMEEAGDRPRSNFS